MPKNKTKDNKTATLFRLWDTEQHTNTFNQYYIHYRSSLCGHKLWIEHVSSVITLRIIILWNCDTHSNKSCFILFNFSKSNSVYQCFFCITHTFSMLICFHMKHNTVGKRTTHEVSYFVQNLSLRFINKRVISLDSEQILKIKQLHVNTTKLRKIHCLKNI